MLLLLFEYLLTQKTASSVQFAPSEFLSSPTLQFFPQWQVRSYKLRLVTVGVGHEKVGVVIAVRTDRQVSNPRFRERLPW